MAGHFPPSSKVTGVRCFTAAVITIRPIRELPATNQVSVFHIPKSNQINER